MATGRTSSRWADSQLLRVCRTLLGSHSRPPDLSRMINGGASEAFLQRAEEHCLVGPLYRVTSQASPPAPEPLAGMLHSAYQRQLAHNHYVIEQLRQALEALDRLDVLVIKGLALASSVYADAGARPTADIDLAVHLSDAPVVARRLEKQGYFPKADFEEKLALYCHGTLERESAAGVPIELHWSVGRNFPSRPMDELLWKDSLPVDVFGVQARTLSAENQLLLACLHLVHHSVFGWQPSLLWLTDVALLIGKESISWPSFLQMVVQQQCERAVYAALVLSERLAGVAAPAEVRAALRAGAGSIGRLASRGALDRLPVSGLPSPVRHLVASGFQGRWSRRGRYLGKHLIKPTLVRMGIWRRGQHQAADDRR